MKYAKHKGANVEYRFFFDGDNFSHTPFNGTFRCYCIDNVFSLSNCMYAVTRGLPQINRKLDLRRQWKLAYRKIHESYITWNGSDE